MTKSNMYVYFFRIGDYRLFVFFWQFQENIKNGLVCCFDLVSAVVLNLELPGADRVLSPGEDGEEGPVLEKADFT